MLIQQNKLNSLSPRPRSFAGLMEMYEANYIRLRRLCPVMHLIETHAVSAVTGALDLHLHIVERSPYTTTLRLTYQFQKGRKQQASPDLQVRIYHDARQAEVLSRNCRRLGSEISAADLYEDTELLCKWRLNRFLYKWLGFCHHQGHLFSLDTVSLAYKPETLTVLLPL